MKNRVSGGSLKDWSGLLDCLGYVREADTVRVASIDSLARSMIDLRQFVGEITAKGAVVEN